MNDRFLRACRGQSVDRRPVWLMRQAGRYMPEYRELRQKYSMLQLCREPELACQVTLQPLRLGMDAAILFSDILLLLEPMGLPVRFSPTDGPVVENPVRTVADIDRLHLIDPNESLPYVMQAIRYARSQLTVPLIGFAGAPFTLASYLIEGGRSNHYAHAKSLMMSEPQGWSRLMSMLTEVIARYLQAQIDAGAHAVQLFDSWVGQLSPFDYEQYVLPYVQTIFRKLTPNSVPLIYFGTATASLLRSMACSGASVIGVDWRVEVKQAWDQIGHHLAIQGNLDPTVLLAPALIMQQRVERILRSVEGMAGYIFNLGHGVMPQTCPDAVRRLVQIVHQYEPRMEL